MALSILAFSLELEPQETKILLKSEKLLRRPGSALQHEAGFENKPAGSAKTSFGCAERLGCRDVLIKSVVLESFPAVPLAASRCCSIGPAAKSLDSVRVSLFACVQLFRISDSGSDRLKPADHDQKPSNLTLFGTLWSQRGQANHRDSQLLEGCALWLCFVQVTDCQSNPVCYFN